MTSPIVLERGVVHLQTLREGDMLHLESLGAPSSLAMFSCALADRCERLSMYTSQSVNHRWQLSEGAVLMSTDSRELWTIVEHDALYVGGGCCAPLLAAPATGSPPSPSCADLLADALEPHGVRRSHVGPDACAVPFSVGRYERDGSFTVQPSARAGDRLTLSAELAQLVALLVCDHGSSAAPAYRMHHTRGRS